jgi:lysyl-tRNA synthetase, class II
MTDVATPNTAERAGALHEQTQARLANLERLTTAGFAAFPYHYPKTHLTNAVKSAHPKPATPEEPWVGEEWPTETLALAGRVVFLRDIGKLVFAVLQDDGGQLQLAFSKKDLPDSFEAVKSVDLGDIIGVTGHVFVTKTGELTLKVASWQPLVKALHPLPSQHYGLTDKEMRYRRRYLDLIMSAESKQVFVTRSKIVRFIRNFLDERGFLEVEGPTLQAIAGGTEAKPFKTFHNALSHEFSMRIALELHLKRLLVGGFEKVFEIGRNYRNEGIDQTHNPEFTMLEFYWAYVDYNAMMALIEEMLHKLVLAVHGSTTITFGDTIIDFGTPFKRLDFTEALKDGLGLDFDPTDLERLRQFSDVHYPQHRKTPAYKLLDKLFGEVVEPSLINPTFVMDVPLAISPLVKPHRSRPGLSERADLFVAGFELAPIYSELNDAREQRARFAAQSARREAGDDEAHEQDEDFLLALEYGMPPAGGMGMGIDRLTMLLTNRQSIRDVVLFPLLRPEGNSHDQSTGED